MATKREECKNRNMACKYRMSDLFSNLPRNTLKCFRGYNLVWQLLAISVTWVSVISGFDWLYFQSSRSPLLQSLLFPAVRLGSRIPILAPLALYVSGKVLKNAKALRIAEALGQAVLIGLLVSSSYKAVTGRVHPPRALAEHVVDSSRVFRFGFMRGGMFWGWPSSHTTIAFAMALTLATLFPRNGMVRYLALFYALYVGFGVSISIHWFSDFAAGAIIGSVIGVVVGKSFRGSRASQSLPRADLLQE
jgi:membrane-associated phospholipid phosphatase